MILLNVNWLAAEDFARAAGSAAGRYQKRDGVLQLRVGEPAAGAVRKNDVPLIPAAAFPLIEDAADAPETICRDTFLRSQADGRRIGRQIGHLADVLQIQIGAHQNRVAEGAHGLHRARPAELDWRAATRAVRGRLAHVVMI